MILGALRAGFAESPFSGSVSFSLNQRFYDDQRLSHINGFSEWINWQFDLRFGVYEFKWGLEPVVGFSYNKNSATLYALDDQGNYIRDEQGNRIASSVDSLSYEFYTCLLGLRWQPFSFLLSPYVELDQALRFGRVHKKTYATDQQKVSNGFEWGLAIGGGLVVSFFWDEGLKQEMKGLWELKNFGLLLSSHYFPSSFYREGLGLVESTQGFDAGVGLFLDW